ncbi:L,D-transpeptidase family protein [Adlercreutzia equolifaciens]|uniref:L,D-transpeptidase family protein n=3 Tax=Adlercreutzia equolifaciens TaxID=446660 RepID=UPI00267402E6|nr:L,D-transpeptidase family protein [Adlercreutzia equolifaciens]
MKKREWGALSFRVRKGTSLFFAGLLCFAMPAMAHAVEMSGEGQTEARPAKAVVENEPADDDALAIIAEEADVAEFGIAVSAQPEIRPEDADAGNAADNAEDSGDVVPDERESGLFPEGSSFRYQYADGTFAVDTWVVADDVRYYFGADGLAVAGRQKIEDCWYFFDDGCRMQTGWVTWKNGTKSFFDWDGRALTGWRSFNGVKYYFDPSTAMSLRWSQKLDGRWYYFDSDSKMVKGWVTWKNGTKSFFDWDGRALTGWRSFNGVKYYFDPSTAMSLRWSQKLDGRWYYFDSASRMTRGIVTWKDGTKSYYDSQGRETGDWIQSDGAWYYFDWSDGKAVRWHQKIDGHWYYFDSDYQMHKGWLKWSGVQKWSYFYSNGQQAFGTQIIGGYRYVFDSNGETSAKPVTLPAGQLAMWNKAQNYYSNTNYIILVNSRTHKVGVFRGSSYNWEPVWYWDCTTGAPGSPTVKGTFTVGSRGKSFGSGYTCWYWTQFYGNYLFHSVLYQPGSMSRIQDGRLGISASHGCVRLDIECARWIYNNIPRGTRVVSY